MGKEKTVKVRFLKGCAGVYGGKSYRFGRGEEADIPIDMAKGLGALIEPVKADEKRRKSVAPKYQKRG